MFGVRLQLICCTYVFTHHNRDHIASRPTMANRLSELPDDLLHRILHFTPLKEAASTNAHSRRCCQPL